MYWMTSLAYHTLQALIYTSILLAELQVMSLFGIQLFGWENIAFQGYECGDCEWGITI